jgi:hypothetical protein
MRDPVSCRDIMPSLGADDLRGQITLLHRAAADPGVQSVHGFDLRAMNSIKCLDWDFNHSKKGDVR